MCVELYGLQPHRVYCTVRLDIFERRWLRATSEKEIFHVRRAVLLRTGLFFYALVTLGFKCHM